MFYFIICGIMMLIVLFLLTGALHLIFRILSAKAIILSVLTLLAFTGVVISGISPSMAVVPVLLSSSVIIAVLYRLQEVYRH